MRSKSESARPSRHPCRQSLTLCAALTTAIFLTACANFGIGKTAAVKPVATKVKVEPRLLTLCDPPLLLSQSGNDPVQNHFDNMDLFWECIDKQAGLIRATAGVVEPAEP